MLRNRKVLYFFLKTILFFAILCLPFSYYDSVYGKFYCNICRNVLGKFQETGRAEFTLLKNSSDVRLDIWNNAIKNQEGKTQVLSSKIDIRYRGYIPTVLFLSLVIATPISRKRKIASGVIGFLFVTALIIIKQWIHILYICGQKEELSLYNFSQGELKVVEGLYSNFAIYNGSTLIIIIAIWILVSFRKSDWENFNT